MDKKKIETALETYINRSITLQRYINEQLIPLKPTITKVDAQNGHSICPFHTETKASFNYWASTDTCYCFGCGIGGDLIAIHRQRVKSYEGRNINRVQATLELIKMYGMQEDATVIQYTQYLQQATRVLQQTLFTAARQKLSVASVIDNTEHLNIPRFRNIQIQCLQDSNIEQRCNALTELDIRAGLTIMQTRK